MISEYYLRIKICGITRREDALAAAALGADALGFIFYPGSPRYVDFDTAREISHALPAGIARVGVFVNPTRKMLGECMEILQPDLLQIHGAHDWEMLREFGGQRLLPAFQVKPDFNPEVLADCRAHCAAFLLDAYRPGKYGGTGRTFDWNLALRAKAHGPVVLSGGLSPENVYEAVSRVQPYAIDVNSGVESAPGIKDKQRLKNLFEMIKEFRHAPIQSPPQRFLAARCAR
ncbi:MAG: phosphoribosylanthranilate isomerase [Calditrichaeota bacterium]|nr:phosphoribosylanthranilate isomerase [Calditrichota bacterium]